MKTDVGFLCGKLLEYILIDLIPGFPASTYPSDRSNCKVPWAEARAGCENHQAK